jgi:hypothetical protein
MLRVGQLLEVEKFPQSWCVDGARVLGHAGHA